MAGRVKNTQAQLSMEGKAFPLTRDAVGGHGVFDLLLGGAQAL